MCHCNGIPNRVMFRVEGLFLARSSEGFKQGSGEDKVGGSVSGTEQKWVLDSEAGCSLQRLPSDLLQQARLHLLKVLWAPKISPPTGKRVQNLSLWGLLLAQAMTVPQRVTLTV